MSDGSARNEKFEQVRRAEEAAASERAEQARAAAPSRSRGRAVLDKLRRGGSSSAAPASPAAAPRGAAAPASAPAAAATDAPPTQARPTPADAAVPRAAEPAATEPDPTEPESTEPGSTEPGSTEPGSAEPEATRPEADAEPAHETADEPVDQHEAEADPEPAPEQPTRADKKDSVSKAEEKERTKQERKERKERKGGKERRGAGETLKAGLDRTRNRIASLVWLVAVVCALFLAVGALLVALKMNQSNDLVMFVVDTAKKLDFGTLKKFTGKNAEVKRALVNYGIAALIYLAVGRILDRLIRP